MRFQSHVQSPLGEADAVIIPLPYDGSASYLKGTALAPEAIIRASDQLEEMEEELRRIPFGGLKIHSLPPVVPGSPEEGPEQYLKRIEEAVRDVPPGALTIGIGGEHSVTVPLALRTLGPGDTFVVIDAHPDLREAYGDSSFSHACASRRIHSAGIRVLQIGLGTISPEEDSFLKEAEGIKQFWAWELAVPGGSQRLMAELKGLSGRVYFSIDCDGLDLSYMPGVGTPIPGGLSWGMLMEVMRAVVRNPAVEVAGFDIVEAMPMEESIITEFSAAKIIQKFLSFYDAAGK